MRPRSVAVASAVLVVLLVAACAAPRNTLGTSSSACFKALPTAKAAVHQKGRLVGVRRVGRTELERALPNADLGPGRAYCVVGFSGPYDSAGVDRPAGDAAGHYAVVVVTARGTTALQTFLSDRLPLRLRH
ncbi:MAG: hypothetical protein JWP02_1566 [Acidimicrobiales bacterium]|nr:hypothetical protein [Acidimicrobiales bacterium]